MTEASKSGMIKNWWAVCIADRQSGAARGFAARVRRASDIEILCEANTHDLAGKLGLDVTSTDRILRLVRVLAEIREDHSKPLASRFGGSEPLLSQGRFDRLMKSEGAELTTGLIRSVRMLPSGSKSCNINQIAGDLLYWNDKTRARWTFEYHGATPPASLSN